MGAGSGLLVVCGVVHAISGGRISLLVAAIALYILYNLEKSSRSISSKNEPPNPTKKSILKMVTKPKSAADQNKELLKKSESPIYAVDFTSTSFTPSGTSVIPKREVRTTRAKRTPKVFKKAMPVKSIVEPTMTKSEVKLLESQIYIFYTSLTGSSQRVATALKEKLA